jgi:hypothetical protein
MSLLESTAQRLLDTLTDSLEEELGRKPRHTRMRGAAYAAAGFALLTAASAGISSVRDRLESAGNS